MARRIPKRIKKQNPSKTKVKVVETLNETTIKPVLPKERKTTRMLKEEFLTILNSDECLGNVTVAANNVGAGRKTVYEWRDKDKQFSARWDAIVFDSKKRIFLEMRNVLLDIARGKGKGAVAAAIYLAKISDPLEASERLVHVGDKDNPVEHEVNMPNSERWLQKEIDREAAKKAKQLVKELSNGKKSHKPRRG